MVQIIIPMSGQGNRFKEAGYQTLKPLIPVDGQPMIKHVLSLFPDEQSVLFICNQEHLENENYQLRKTLTELCSTAQVKAIPSHKLGPVYAVMQATELISDDDEVIVSYCDYSSYWNYQDFLTDTRSRKADGCVVAYRGFHPHMLGTDNYAFMRCSDTTGDSRWMEEIQEKKPFTNDRMAEWASNGTYYFKTGSNLKKYCHLLMDSGQTVKDEYYMSMVYNQMVKDGLKVSIYPIEHMLQWGTPYDLEVYQNWSDSFKSALDKQNSPTEIGLQNPNGCTTLLPLAGRGSRFSARGYILPKPLLPVNGNPMVIQAIGCLPSSDHQVFVCLQEHLETYPLKKELLKFYPNAQVIGIPDVTEGQAVTCELGIDQGKINLDKPLLITACDNGALYKAEAYQQLLADQTIDGIIWSFRHNPTSRNNPQMYSWLELKDGQTDGSGQIEKVWVKQCPFDNPYEHQAIIGTMFFKRGTEYMKGLKQIYEKNVRANGEFYVDNVLNEMIANELKLVSFPVDHYLCWGTADDYETYLYWQEFFHKCQWHPYSKDKDYRYRLLKN